MSYFNSYLENYKNRDMLISFYLHKFNNSQREEIIRKELSEFNLSIEYKDLINNICDFTNLRGIIKPFSLRRYDNSYEIFTNVDFPYNCERFLFTQFKIKYNYHDLILSNYSKLSNFINFIKLNNSYIGINSL